MDKSTIALFIASISLAISLFNLRLNFARYKITIEHNKKTLKPKLSFCSDEKDGKFTIKIENKGQGPATLESVKWVLYGEPTTYNNFISRLKLACELSALCSEHESNSYEVVPKLVIAQGETKNIFESPTMKIGEVDKYKKYFKENYKIFITYKSDYGDEFKAQTPQ